MAASNFEACLAILISPQVEGGYVNNPKDPGGATNMGVTQRVFSTWLKARGLSNVSVRYITHDQVAAIYKAQYWDACRCDELPKGVDLMVFDLAVNSGPVKSIKILQQAIGLTGKQIDGHIGLITLSRINGPTNYPRLSAAQIINANAQLRLSFLKKLANWKWFGRGWNNRVAFVRSAALKMAG